uniref:Uncharacterized protein n=1 Tax=Arundo donax TaxID=35708 RepID=A0A0A9H4H6_ARUDO
MLYSLSLKESIRNQVITLCSWHRNSNRKATFAKAES